MSRSLLACAALALALGSCGPAPGNDPIYQALKANPPTEIPARHLPKLRQGRFSCDVHNEGKASQYMTCWWPAPNSRPPVAKLTYYGPAVPSPRPERIIAPGGTSLTGFLPIR